jgi:nucleotide-binding universal stress UspA family protein
MSPIHKILVAVDVGEVARPIVEYAAMLAKPWAASIHLVHVWQPPLLLPSMPVVVPPSGGPSLGADEVARSMAEARLRELADDARRAGVTNVVCVVGVGDPAHEICELASTEQCDLIVMGTHGRAGLAHALLGSVAEKVLRRAPCPVLTLSGKPLPPHAD